MTQTDIDRAVAEALGESICEVQLRGFSLLEPELEFLDAEEDCPPPKVIDWDGVAGEPTVGSFYECAV